MGKIADIWNRLYGLYVSAKTEIIELYAEISEDSGHEDYIEPCTEEDLDDCLEATFGSLTDIMSLADDIQDWYTLLRKWQSAGTTAARDAALTELNTQLTDIYDQYGIKEDYLAVVRLATGNMTGILDELDLIVDKFGN